MKSFVDQLIERYGKLDPIRPVIETAIRIVIDTFEREGTLFVCGNGGSGSDAEHIAGEFLKGFILKRPIPAEEKRLFGDLFGPEGTELAEKLQRGLRCISLLSHPGFITAFCNDVDPTMIFAQQLYALGRSGDAVIGISASGNAGNIRQAFMAARTRGIKTILLTGGGNGRCVAFADLVVPVPEKETFKIQELHLPFYHTLCMAVEDHFFNAGTDVR